MTRVAPTDVAGLARYILSDECRQIAILNGPFASASSGFPEYKTRPPSPFLPTNPDLLTTTDMDQLQELRKNPSAVLTWDLFRENSLPYLEVMRPFILATSEQKYKSTVCHQFAELLHTNTGKLRRVYTNNVDGLDFRYCSGSGGRLPASKILPINGSLAQAQCEGCGAPANYERFCESVRQQIKNVVSSSSEKDDAAAPTESTHICCKNCNAPLVKPTVILLRRASTPETLHRKFFEQLQEDLPHLDLLLILGQKMWALPASHLIGDAAEKTVRVVVQPNPGGSGGMSTSHLGLDFDNPGGSRDSFLQGNPEDVVKDLIQELGWEKSATGTARRPDPPAMNGSRQRKTMTATEQSGAVSQQQFAPQKHRPRGQGGKYKGPATTGEEDLAQTLTTVENLAVHDQEGAEMLEFKDQCRSVESRPVVAQARPQHSAQTRPGTQTEYHLNIKDQCRSVEGFPADVPFATVVHSWNENDSEDDGFVFRTSCALVGALEASHTPADIVKAIKSIGSAANRTNPNHTQESHAIVAAGGLEAIRERMKAYPKDLEIQESA